MCGGLCYNCTYMKLERKEGQIEQLLTRGVEEIITLEHLKNALLSGKKLRVKFGIDPTKPDIHLGHTVPLLKLREFQKLGHKAVLIIGDFTAQIGDPSGQSAERKPLTKKEVKMNMRHYLAQAGKVIDVKRAEVRYNSEWLTKLDGQKLTKLLMLISVQQMIERNDFKERIEKGKSLRMQELLYPVFQAYDSVMIKADLEIGGSDQKFNLLTGRTLMERLRMKPQDIITLPLIEGTDGVRKMSKSYDNYVAMNDTPNDMFGKLMRIPDSLINKYFELLTEANPPNNANPYAAKLLLAETIVEMYHSPLLAQKAREEFKRVFSKKETPYDITDLRIRNLCPFGTSPAGGELGIMELLLAANVPSKSEARRLLAQGAVKLNEKTLIDPDTMLILKGGEILKIGKHRFFKIRLIRN